jgi:hypothetical protein
VFSEPAGYATVRANKDTLLEYGELRNAIVHDRGKAPIVLADPREDVVLDIENICRRLTPSVDKTKYRPSRRTMTCEKSCSRMYA